MNTNFTPMPFVKKYFVMKSLEKYIKRSVPDARLFDSYSGDAYTALRQKKIFLPFMNEFSYDDLLTLAQHEIGHIFITKESAVIPISYSVPFNKVTNVLNYLEDMIINRKIPLNRIKKINRIIKTEVPLNTWEHLNKAEKKELVETGINKGVFKDSYSVDHIIEKIDEAITLREGYPSLRKFFDENKSFVKELCDLFTDSDDPPVGNGHAEYDSSYRLPYWDIVNEIRRMILNFRVRTHLYREEERFYGKKINRRYILDDSEIYPFIKKDEKVTINLPRVLCILDCSGSMEGEPEKLAKSFLVPFLDVLKTTVVCVNEYFVNIVKNSQQMIQIPMTGDDEFDKATIPDSIMKKKYDLAILVTDLQISSDEVEGAANLMNRVRTPNKYLLCVNKQNEDTYKEQITFERIIMENKDDLIAFIKKIMNTKRVY